MRSFACLQRMTTISFPDFDKPWQHKMQAFFFLPVLIGLLKLEKCWLNICIYATS